MRKYSVFLDSPGIDPLEQSIKSQVKFNKFILGRNKVNNLLQKIRAGLVLAKGQSEKTAEGTMANRYHTATTTARPAYDQIPKPTLFENNLQSAVSVAFYNKDEDNINFDVL